MFDIKESDELKDKDIIAASNLKQNIFEMKF